MNDSKVTTIRLTPEDQEVIERLQKRLGLGLIDVLRLCIRRMDERLSGIRPDDKL